MQARRTLTPGQKGTKKFIEVKLAGSKWNTAKLVWEIHYDQAVVRRTHPLGSRPR